MDHGRRGIQVLGLVRGQSLKVSTPPRLPFFYGWVIVAVAFVTMGLGVNARTAFSLLFPPILDEFGWERGLTAGAFSFGFLVSAVLSPFVRRLVEIGVSATHAAWALGFVSLAGIPGQIALGHVSDRIGCEWVWTIGSLGFGLCFLALLGLYHGPPPMLLYLMVDSQGMLGYGLTSVIGAIPAEIFQSPHYGTIFGTLMLVAIGGGAAGPWVTGALHDATGELRTGLLDRHWVQCAIGRGNLVHGAAQGAGRCRPHPSESSPAAWGLGESSARPTSCPPQPRHQV
jgi:Major Facilitator Superfamily